MARRAAWAQKKPPVSVAPSASANRAGSTSIGSHRDEAARSGVHQDVEAVQGVRRLLDCAPCREAVGQVGADGTAAGARVGQRRRRQLGVRRGIVVGEGDLRAALAQAERDGAAEAPGASRHEHAGARDVHRLSRPRASAGSRG